MSSWERTAPWIITDVFNLLHDLTVLTLHTQFYEFILANDLLFERATVNQAMEATLHRP